MTQIRIHRNESTLSVEECADHYKLKLEGEWAFGTDDMLTIGNFINANEYAKSKALCSELDEGED